MKGNLSKQLLKKLILFSVPLILSGLLQQLFNWVDALIVGNLIGETALGGIGAVTSLYNLFVTTIIGLTSGLSVLFAQQYGRGAHTENTKVLAGYAMIFGIAFSVISLLAILFTGPILTALGTPERLFADARDYLMVVLAGVPFLAVYNTYSAALRGMGNSKIPFIAVLISSVTNGVLDYVLIVFCKTGVWGAALATVVSQIAMMGYIIAYTVRKYPELRFSPVRWKSYCGAMKRGGKYAVPPAIQSSVTSVGNLFLQRFMNSFGQQTVAAITTAYRVDTVLLLPILNFSTAISTIVAQEIGAGNEKKARKVFRMGTIVMAILSLVLTGIILLFGKLLLSIFGLTEESVVIGTNFFTSIAIFYVVYGISMSIKGYLEGRSDLLFSGIVGICGLGVRIGCSYVFSGIFGNMVIAYAEAFSWIFLLAVYALRYFAKRKHPVKN